MRLYCYALYFSPFVLFIPLLSHPCSFSLICFYQLFVSTLLFYFAFIILYFITASNLFLFVLFCYCTILFLLFTHFISILFDLFWFFSFYFFVNVVVPQSTQFEHSANQYFFWVCEILNLGSKFLDSVKFNNFKIKIRNNPIPL